MFGVRVTSGLDKVEARVDFLAVDVSLLLKVRTESRLDVVEDRLPAAQASMLEWPSAPQATSRSANPPLIVVHEATETSGVDDSQADSHSAICGNEKPRVRRQTRGQGGAAEPGLGRRTSADALDGDGFGALCAGREGFLGHKEGC